MRKEEEGVGRKQTETRKISSWKNKNKAVLTSLENIVSIILFTISGRVYSC